MGIKTMNIKKVLLAPVSLAVLAFLGLAGTSTKAAAGGWYDDNPKPFSAICQSNQAYSGGSPYTDCGSCSTAACPLDDATPQVLVPASTKKNYCFFLTDFTAENNNADKQIDLRNQSASRANPAIVVLASRYDGTGPTLAKQDWSTPLVFTGALYVDVHFPNNNLYITVSGYYDRCP